MKKKNEREIENYRRKFNFYSKNSQKIARSLNNYRIDFSKKLPKGNQEEITSRSAKTEKGYEINFESSNKSRYSQNEDRTSIKNSTIKNEIDTENILIQNAKLKEALMLNDMTNNSLEEELLFNNDYNVNQNNNNNNQGNNNEILKELIDNENVKEDKVQSNGHIVINFSGENNNSYFNNPYNSNSNIVFKSQLFSSSLLGDNSKIKDISLYSKLNSKQMVKKKIFQQKPCYNLSSRLINDEDIQINNNNHMRKPISIDESFKFITKLNKREDKEKSKIEKRKGDMQRILYMKRNIILKIIQFMFDDIDELRASFPSMETKINEVLTYYYFEIVNSFNIQYSDYFELYEYFFKNNQRAKKKIINKRFDKEKRIPFKLTQKIKRKKTSFDLYIKAKIISNFDSHTHSFSLLYKNTNQKEIIQPEDVTNSINIGEETFYLSTWKFDLLDKKNSNLWITSESEEFCGIINRFSYRMPILSYAKDDFIIIKVTLMSFQEMIDTNSIQWDKMQCEEINISKVNFLNFTKTSYLNQSINQAFDKNRYCELERIIHLWKSAEYLRKRNIVEEIIGIFKDHFEYERMDYDIRKFYIFKLKVKAKKCGVVRKNKFFNFNINIKEANSNIENETQCLGVLNWVDLENIDIRVGQICLCYFTEICG